MRSTTNTFTHVCVPIVTTMFYNVLSLRLLFRRDRALLFPRGGFCFFRPLLLLEERAFALLCLDLLQRSSQRLVVVENALVLLHLDSFTLRAFLFLLAALARALFERTPLLFSRPRGVGSESRRRLHSEPFARALALSLDIAHERFDLEVRT